MPEDFPDELIESASDQMHALARAIEALANTIGLMPDIKTETTSAVLRAMARLAGQMGQE